MPWRKLRGVLVLAALVSLTVTAAVNAATIIKRGACASRTAVTESSVPEETASAGTVPEETISAGTVPEETASSGPAQGEPVRAERGIIRDPVTGEEYSDRVIIVSVDQDMTDGMMQELLGKYTLSVVYDYRSFHMYALSAARSLSAEEMAELIRAVSGEPHVLNVSRDGVVHLIDPVTADR